MRPRLCENGRIVRKLREVELVSARERKRVERLVAAERHAHVAAQHLDRHLLRDGLGISGGGDKVRTRVVFDHGYHAVVLDAAERLHVADLRARPARVRPIGLRTHQEVHGVRIEEMLHREVSTHLSASVAVQRHHIAVVCAH